MNILIIGNGGREHSIIWKIFNSPSFNFSSDKIFCSIGNPGINQYATPINIKSDDISGLLKFALEHQIDLTLVGPEIPLSLGIVDEFRKSKLKIFGPEKYAAMLESSKIFAKNFMIENNIPTAKFKSFNLENVDDAFKFLSTLNFPLVIKADGLAAGKGVFIAENFENAKSFIIEITQNKIFGESGEHFIIEEFLDGFEISIFVITDGENFIVLPSAQDHKKIGDGDTGKNTGGMGAYSPADSLLSKSTFDKIKNNIILPTLKGMQNNGHKYTGCLYVGLMISNKNGIQEPNVIEYNCRFGDPETQAVLPLIKSDFLQLILSAVNSDINNYNLEIETKFSVCVIAASKGYPEKYETNKIISGLNKVSANTIVFHSGTKFSNDKNTVTNGGRVISLVTLSDTSFENAIDNAYIDLKNISFENIYYRTDIGKKFFQLKKQL